MFLLCTGKSVDVVAVLRSCLLSSVSCQVNSQYCQETRVILSWTDFTSCIIDAKLGFFFFLAYTGAVTVSKSGRQYLDLRWCQSDNLVLFFRTTEHSAEMNGLCLQIGNSPKSLSGCNVREFKVRLPSRTAVFEKHSFK